mmetsp:Transcript_10038/g.13129  ORF Transcript_10038/g.13129 Transcript_10038/m.13129 type:complete len:88 (+) Transcript_10038:759-1022(+)
MRQKKLLRPLLLPEGSHICQVEKITACCLVSIPHLDPTLTVDAEYFLCFVQKMAKFRLYINHFYFFTTIIIIFLSYIRFSFIFRSLP